MAAKSAPAVAGCVALLAIGSGPGAGPIAGAPLRLTCGSLLAALDVHPRIAMQILRHSKIAVTMEIYTHVPSEATHKALRRLGKHLGKQDRK